MLRRILTCALIGALCLLPARHARSALLGLEAFDRQAHVVVAFQSAVTATTVFELLDQPKWQALTSSAVAVMGVALLKEYVFDARPSAGDLEAGALGTALGIGAMAFWPSDSHFTVEPEGGLLYATGRTVPPSTLFNAQDTFWYRHSVGLHFFSGGWMKQSSNPSGRRLMFGGGARFALLPLPFTAARDKAVARAWLGIDYGYLLFSAAQVERFVTAAYVPLFSGGVTFYPPGTRVFAAAQFTLAPYAGELVKAAGGQFGWTF